MHEEIEPLIEETPGGAFAFLEGAISSARSYMHIIEGDPSDASALRSLRALRRVEYDEWISALLAYLNRPVEGMPQTEFITLLEKITMQNWVRRLGRAARLTVYYQLINAIREGRGAQEVRQIFRKNAQNAEFLELLGGELYGKRFDGAVLLRLEEAMHDESVTLTYSGLLTIEHVLPQALKESYWQTRFTHEQHSLWLHRLGNLVPLSGRKNYQARHYDFERKKRIYNDRNAKVSFELTKEVCAQADWTVETIKERHERLMELARKIWTID